MNDPPEVKETRGQPERLAPFYLAPRQRQVLALAAEGLTEKEIAVTLAISARTVRNHLDRARERLGARNTTHAVALAIARGVIDPPG